MPREEFYQKHKERLNCKETCECGTIYRAKDKSQHQRSAAHIFKTTGKLPEKCFDIEEGPNYYRIQDRRQNLKVNIKKRFCNDTKKKHAFDKINAEQARLIALYC
jgi:hypothetical protein